MIPEKSTFTCSISWQADNQDYDTFSRLGEVVLPGGARLTAGGAHLVQDPKQTNPEELFAAAVGTCMMMTILAVFSKSRIPVTSYEDQPEALLELVERRFRVTKVTLRPKIRIGVVVECDKLDNLIAKSHANCFITLSVNSEVVVEPTFIND
jgi:organic hydroperoxide reductase OsmC/OhrA